MCTAYLLQIWLQGVWGWFCHLWSFGAHWLIQIFGVNHWQCSSQDMSCVDGNSYYQYAFTPVSSSLYHRDFLWALILHFQASHYDLVHLKFTQSSGFPKIGHWENASILVLKSMKGQILIQFSLSLSCSSMSAPVSHSPLEIVSCKVSEKFLRLS